MNILFLSVKVDNLRKKNDFKIFCSSFKVYSFLKYRDIKSMRCEKLQWNGSEIFLAAKKVAYLEKTKSAIKMC